MKLLDEKGRIFGKINIIDLFVIVAIVAAVAFVGLRFVNPKVSTVANSDDLVLTFFTEQIPNYVAENIEIGGFVEDEAKGANLGTITNIEVGEGYVFTPDDKGNQVKAYVEGFSSIKITTSAKGQVIENGGFKISGNTYVIGHGFTIRAGKGKIYTRLAGFEIANK